MKIYTYPLGELQANCYLIEEEGHGLIIDPADDGSFLLEEIQRKNITLKNLLLTHGHFDHCMAVGEIQMSFDVPMSLDKKDQFLINRLESTAEHFLKYKPVMVPPIKTSYLSEGEYTLGSRKYQVISTPGHTPGSVCFYFPEEDALFTGDTLFASAIGSTDHPYSNKGDLWKSLRKILSLPDQTTIYPGHGESSYVGQEKYIIGEK